MTDLLGTFAVGAFSYLFAVFFATTLIALAIAWGIRWGITWSLKTISRDAELEAWLKRVLSASEKSDS